MTQSKPEPADIRLTDDVKEALFQGKGLAEKRTKALGAEASSEAVLDRDILLGLLKTNRPFCRQDALFRQLALNPKTLIQQLEAQALARLTATRSEDSGADAETLLDTAYQQMAAEKNGSADASKVDVEHLLKALCHSNDPAVSKVFKTNALDERRFENARQGLQEKSAVGVPKGSLYSSLFYAREIIEMAFFVIVLLIVIKEGFGELRLIPSESMLPGLQIGDRLVIEKVTRWFRPHERGDILVFYPPEPLSELHNDPVSVFLRATGFTVLFHNTADDPVDKAFIKRLIGLPGDIIQVIPGVGVYVNDALLDEPYVNEIAMLCGDEFCKPQVIPEGFYLMLGDNRNRSKDGRFFGLVDKNRVVGRAVFRVLPADRIGTLD